MCDCLSWDSAVFRAAAKLARCRPDTVFAVFSALEVDGDRAPRLRPEILAAGLGRRVYVVQRILASLVSLGVTCDGVVTAQWRRSSADSAERGLSMKPSAIRMRQKRLRDRATTISLPQSAAASSAGVTNDAMPPSLSFFPDPQGEQKEQKQTRAGAISDEGDGFAELWALWPVHNRMAEAESDYRRVRRTYSTAELLAAAQRYLDTKPAWQTPLFLMNWLRTDPCRDPVLPLSAPLREVATAGITDPKPRSPDWIKRKAELFETGRWPAEWGPRWGEPGCLLLFEKCPGIASAVAAWFRDHDQRMTG